MNKTIYMTYKKPVPALVPARWKELNPDYDVELSLDKDCVEFLETHFNRHVADLFRRIPTGYHKADLWRLCKLYIHGGVYADVDLIPHLRIDDLDRDVTFYSCLSILRGTTFQAFMVHFGGPKNPLLLCFLLSFLLHEPYRPGPTSPCKDMYECIQYNLGGAHPLPEKKYRLDTVRIRVDIGPCLTKTKTMDLFYFPSDIRYTIHSSTSTQQGDATFHFEIQGTTLVVTRTDRDGGWDHSHSCDICLPSKETIFLFPEHRGSNGHWTTSYVTHNNIKILDSRDMNYYHNKGW